MNQQNTKDNTKKQKSKLRDALDFLLPIVIALIVAMLLKTFVFANAVVPSGSMLNTIQIGDRIIASRIEYNFNDPERYDIIIFRPPEGIATFDEEYYVKRIIGLPGETIKMKDGVVYVSDSDGKWTKLRDDFITACEPIGDFGPYTIPENNYFVMGDNRNDSFDSRAWNENRKEEERIYVERDSIIGKVKFRYYPFNTFGKLDNF